MANYNAYVSWELLKEYIPIPTNQTRDDKNLFRICIEASRKFDAHCHGRHFYPIKQTRYYDMPGNVCDDSLLILDDDLLEVSSLTTANGTQTISSNDYLLKTGDTYNFPPYDRIELKGDGVVTAFSYSGSPQQANTVTGLWGYHDDWANAWQDSLDTTEDNPLSASATEITVNDADGANIFGLTPRFMIQQILRIESEYVFVTGKNVITNKLTVIRGVNGTTAAAHAQNTPIYIYQPMDVITQAMEVLATYIYRRREAVGSSTDRGTAANGVLVMPARLPDDVTDILDIYKRWTIS
jgi:hypothetical protein